MTLDEKLLVFKEIKIIFTRYDFDLLFPVGEQTVHNTELVLRFDIWLHIFAYGIK
jgi:hypothetical protein